VTGQTFPEAFGAVVARQPEHLALVDDERALTYGDVWGRRVAWRGRSLPRRRQPGWFVNETIGRNNRLAYAFTVSL
jgi:hypothetical protein